MDKQILEQKQPFPLNPANNVLKEPTLGTKIREVSLEWIKMSTSHGLPRVFQTDQMYLKIFWFILFIVSTGCCIYLTYASVVSFFEYDVIVNIAVNKEQSMLFPAITFCNLVPFNYQKAKTTMQGILSSYNLSSLSTSSSFDASSLYNIKYALERMKFSVASDSKLTESQRRALGFNLSEMMLSCTFNGDNCNSNDFYQFWSYDYGNCFTFNKGEYANGTSRAYSSTTSAGPSSGLEIELYVGDSKLTDQYVYKRGIIVVVQNQSYSPLMNVEGIHVPTAAQTNIAIRTTFMSKLPSPYSDCLSDVTSQDAYDSDLYKGVFLGLNETTYRKDTCFLLCLQKAIVSYCNCSDPSTPSPPGQTHCTTETDFKCIVEVKSVFVSKGLSKKCNDYCPVECDSVTYSTTVSTATYPTEFYSGWLQKDPMFNKLKINGSSFSSSILKLNVFYEKLEYTEITETASMTWDVLLSNIGGTLGKLYLIRNFEFF